MRYWNSQETCLGSKVIINHANGDYWGHIFKHWTVRDKARQIKAKYSA